MCLGEIVRLDAVEGSTGVAHLGERPVRISLVTLDEPVASGDWVVVHSGFALQRLDPGQAADALSLRGEQLPPTIERPPVPRHPITPTQEQP